MSDEIAVVAAIIRKGDRYLVTRRPDQNHLGGLWEFPGGKLEAGESPEDGVMREIYEELGIRIQSGPLVYEQRHSYPDRDVHLRFFECRLIDGTPETLGVAEFRWATADELGTLEFPEGNSGLIERLIRLSQ